MQIQYFFGLVAALFFYGSLAQAFEATWHTVPTAYEVVSILNPETEQLILGELDGDPEMFEIFSETPFILTTEIRAVPNKTANTLPAFSGIIIKQKELRGVEEVSRLQSADADWSVMTDNATGLKYQAGPYFSEAMASGTYRIEISSLNNTGKYILLVGNQSDNNSYQTSLAAIRAVYRFYGFGSVRMFSSPYVHYPVGIALVVLLFTGTYSWQRNQKRYA